MAVRELEGRQASPTAGIIDSQSGKTAENGDIRGYDAGKKIKGRKRHIVVDTLGLMFGLVVHAADIQDRDGAPITLALIRALRSTAPSYKAASVACHLRMKPKPASIAIWF